MSRSRRHKKQFPCGHVGFGQICHQCTECDTPETVPIELVPSLQNSDPPPAEKQEWKQTFADDRIDLTGLPKAVVLRARQILTALEEGASYQQFRGKRFNFDREVISIPVTHRYRLLCRHQEGAIVPLKVVSHEEYNPISRNKVKLGKG